MRRQKIGDQAQLPYGEDDDDFYTFPKPPKRCHFNIILNCVAPGRNSNNNSKIAKVKNNPYKLN